MQAKRRCISPFQGYGIGRALMAGVERAAIERGIEILVVPSSITAQQFYTKIGFSPVRDSHEGEERIILMERQLPRKSNQVA